MASPFGDARQLSVRPGDRAPLRGGWLWVGTRFFAPSCSAMQLMLLGFGVWGFFFWQHGLPT